MTEENIQPKQEEMEADSTLTEQAQDEVVADQPAELLEEDVDVTALQGELESWQSKATEYLDGWQRARAEFANYKKRVEREQAQVYQNAAGNTIKRFLDVSDDLERALKNRPQEGDGLVWAEGIELIYRKLLSLLEAEGVKKMDADGHFFDPNLHEAIMQENNPDFESGQIIEVVKQGYWIGERVLRPAQVRVAS